MIGNRITRLTQLYYFLFFFFIFEGTKLAEFNNAQLAKKKKKKAELNLTN